MDWGCVVLPLLFVFVDQENCIAMYNAGALPYLIQGMKGDIEGMRAACAQTARNIYVLGRCLSRLLVCACIPACVYLDMYIHVRVEG